MKRKVGTAGAAEGDLAPGGLGPAAGLAADCSATVDQLGHPALLPSLWRQVLLEGEEAEINNEQKYHQ